LLHRCAHWGDDPGRCANGESPGLGEQIVLREIPELAIDRDAVLVCPFTLGWWANVTS